MDLVVATSRGRSLAHYFKYRWTAHLIWKKGARISQLVEEADKFLGKHKVNTRPHHVFFLAGLPDMTQRLKDKDDNYDEVTYTEPPEQTLDRISASITSAIYLISSQHHARVSFATITPISIKTWNEHRLNISRTSRLKHQQMYDTMQENLISATVMINKYILKINERNNIPTPRLAKKIIKKVGKKRKTPRVYYGKLPDGVHPNESTAEEWIDIISMTMLEARHPEFFLNGQYTPSLRSHPINPRPTPEPEVSPPMNSPSHHLPTLEQASDASEEEEPLLRRQWRSY